MFFQRKSWLRNEFDEKLINGLNKYKLDWQQQKQLLAKSFDPSEEVICESKLAEAKYFFLLKEAKHRNIRLNR
ncbi:YaaL family protein [Bacillus sp. EB600]|uniref:YaaL family protein n=1 Tax=Bacillus sp. EB600 TaxID=2806345 RepID=UPI002109C877|nr:YaaL family protein [Bacillus sp. EB600]MCQ6282733.1 YaaL family protein [Bacillus sp. EB600]